MHRDSKNSCEVMSSIDCTMRASVRDRRKSDFSSVSLLFSALTGLEAMTQVKEASRDVGNDDNSTYIYGGISISLEIVLNV